MLNLSFSECRTIRTLTHSLTSKESWTLKFPYENPASYNKIQLNRISALQLQLQQIKQNHCKCNTLLLITNYPAAPLWTLDFSGSQGGWWQKSWSTTVTQTQKNGAVVFNWAEIIRPFHHQFQVNPPGLVSCTLKSALGWQLKHSDIRTKSKMIKERWDWKQAKRRWWHSTTVLVHRAGLAMLLLQLGNVCFSNHPDQVSV